MQRMNLQKALHLRRRLTTRRRRARQRRGMVRKTFFEVSPLAAAPPPNLANRFSRRMLDRMAENLSGYPHVAGLLYRDTGARMEVIVIAPAPMTRPMERIARIWAERLSHACPHLDWSMHSAERPPPKWREQKWQVWQEHRASA